jgi:hypothetical protein
MATTKRIFIFPPEALNARRQATCCGNSYAAGDNRVAGRAEGSTPLVERSLCDDPNGRLYLFGVKGNICCAAIVLDNLGSAAPSSK